MHLQSPWLVARWLLRPSLFRPPTMLITPCQFHTSHLFLPFRAARHAHEGVADDLNLVHAILLAQTVVLAVWGRTGREMGGGASSGGSKRGEGALPPERQQGKSRLRRGRGAQWKVPYRLRNSGKAIRQLCLSVVGSAAAPPPPLLTCRHCSAGLRCGWASSRSSCACTTRCRRRGSTPECGYNRRGNSVSQ